MIYKQFDRALYEADDNAKHLIITWLELRGNKARVNPDDYGIDLLVSNELGNYGVEVEVKHNWSGPAFPYPDVHWPVRKLKFAELEGSWFFMLNNERTHFIAAPGWVLLQSQIVSKATKYTKSEDFIAVPAKTLTIFRVQS